MTGMDALNPRARALIERSRASLRAKPGDRERIEAALRARLGPDALPTAESVAPISSTATWQLVAGATVAAVVLGGAVFWGLASRTTPPPQAAAAPAAPAPRALTPSTVTPVAPSSEAATPTPVEAAATSTTARAKPPARDELAREVALLSRATKELRAGHTRKALNTLEAHRRQFPNGLLREERRAATAQALCISGRLEEGRAEQANLEQGSPAAARAKQICDAAARQR